MWTRRSSACGRRAWRFSKIPKASLTAAFARPRSATPAPIGSSCASLSTKTASTRWDGEENFPMPGIMPSVACLKGVVTIDLGRTPMKLFLRHAILTGALVAASVALAQTATPAKIAETSKGKALVDAKGMTLYTFDKDATGKSNCNGTCAQNWPPLKADASAKASGEWSPVKRDDGSMQWAYKGKPLYTW